MKPKESELTLIDWKQRAPSSNLVRKLAQDLRQKVNYVRQMLHASSLSQKSALVERVVGHSYDWLTTVASQAEGSLIPRRL